MFSLDFKGFSSSRSRTMIDLSLGLPSTVWAALYALSLFWLQVASGVTLTSKQQLRLREHNADPILTFHMKHVYPPLFLLFELLCSPEDLTGWRIKQRCDGGLRWKGQLWHAKDGGKTAFGEKTKPSHWREKLGCLCLSLCCVEMHPDTRLSLYI